MPKPTKSAARNLKRSEVNHGNPKKPKAPAEEKFLGTLSRHILNYRELPEDDPLRIELTKKYG